MINCKEATRLISQQEEAKLSFAQRLQLWLHLSICSFCRLFYKQNKIITHHMPHVDKHSDDTLTQSEKEAIIAALESSRL